MLENTECSLKVACRFEHKLALLVIDLEHFKNINNSYGHQAGDELLIDVEQRMTKRIRSVDTLCRLGGDEFAVLIAKVDKFEESAQIAKGIIESLRGPWRLSNGVQVHIGASIGISLYPEHRDTAQLLMQSADAALYKAKRIKRGTFEFFTQDMTDASRKKIEMEARLRKCVEEDHLEVFLKHK